jgi:hypothetical protein
VACENEKLIFGISCVSLHLNLKNANYSMLLCSPSGLSKGCTNDEHLSAFNNVVRHISCDSEFAENASIQGPGELAVLSGTNEGQ